MYRFCFAMKIPRPDLWAAACPADVWLKWQEFAAREPFGFEWDWRRVGTVAATVYNTAPFRKGGSPPVDPTQFVPGWRRPVAGWEQQKAALMRWAGGW